MKRNTATLIGILIPLLAAISLAQDGAIVVPAGGVVVQEPGKGPAEVAVAPAKPKKVVPKPVPVRFEATVYQVDVAVDQIAALDAKFLASKATTAVALETVLKTMGNTRALYRVDQAIDLRTRAQLTISSSVPVITSVSSVGEKKSTTISREKLGAKFQLVSSFDPDEPATGPIPLSIEVEISAVADSGVEFSGANAPVQRSVTQSNGGVATLGRPIVLITADGAGSPDGKSSSATAFVTLIQLSAVGE